MRPLSPTLLASVAMLSAMCSAQAGVATFDDIGSAGAVPHHYAGLDWSAGGWSFSDALQTPYKPHSGAFAAYTRFDATDASSLIRFDAPSVLSGAWFAGLEGATVTFQMYSKGALVATSSTLDPTATPSFLASGYAGAIDSVRISSPGHSSFVMDDLKTVPVHAVPEPETHALMLLGLLVLGVSAQRQRRR